MREGWCLPINQIFNYWIYDRKHVASILSSSFLAMSVAQRVPSQHSPINHLGDPIRFTLFPLLAICSSSCCRCIPSHSCFFFLLAVDSHSYLSLHPHMQPEAFCHQNVTKQEVNSVLPRIMLITAEELWMQTCHPVSCWYIANSANYYYANKRISEDCWLRKVLLRTSSTVREINSLKALTWRLIYVHDWPTWNWQKWKGC